MEDHVIVEHRRHPRVLLLRKGYVREILNADIMAKKTHITAPADRLNGVIIEKDGKQYLDTGIGLILEMDKKADSNVKYAETDFTDCDHDRWAGHYRFIKETLEACEIFSRRIAEKKHNQIKVYPSMRQCIADSLNLK